MQNELLDIIIIGCLVLLFASTYRKRATPMVGYWTVGWVIILIHFTAMLFHPSSALAQNVLLAIALVALFACGTVFLLASINKGQEAEPSIAYLLTAGCSAVAFVLLQLFGLVNHLPFLALTLIGEVSWLGFALKLSPRLNHDPGVDHGQCPGVHRLVALEHPACTSRCRHLCPAG